MENKAFTGPCDHGPFLNLSGLLQATRSARVAMGVTRRSGGILQPHFSQGPAWASVKVAEPLSASQTVGVTQYPHPACPQTYLTPCRCLFRLSPSCSPWACGLSYCPQGRCHLRLPWVLEAKIGRGQCPTQETELLRPRSWERTRRGQCCTGSAPWYISLPIGDPSLYLPLSG